MDGMKRSISGASSISSGANRGMSGVSRVVGLIT